MRTTKAFAAKAGIALAVVYLGASAFAGFKPISGTYAESGLVARWDAIDNTGTGTHDFNATTWKDLVGDNDMTIVSTSGAEWRNGNAFYMNSLANGVCPAYGKSGNTAYKTIEIVYKKATSKGRILWCGGVNTRYVVFDYTDTAAPWKNAKVYFDGAKATQHTVVSDCEPTSLVALYNDSNAVTGIYRDGEENNAGAKNANTWSVDGNSTMVRLGSRSKTNTDQNKSNGWEGEVFTIRLYDRQLTPLEIARNYSLDAARFFGEGFATNVVVATAVEGLEGSETSGMYMIDAEGHEFSAPKTATKSGAIYDCTGYTLETWNGSGWGESVAHDGETSCTLSDTSALVRITWQWAPAEIVAQDYAWMASPANANWDGSSANWNSGEAWVDGNNAVFGSSSQTTLTIGSERLVNDLTVNNVAYTFNGAGPLRVKGTITPVGAKDQHFNVPLASGRDDGSLHFYATGVDWRSAYLDSVNNLQTSTVLDGTVFIMAKGDGSFGPAPAVPTENIAINSGNPTIYGNASITVHSNRIVKIKSGAALWTGSNSPFTYKAQIVAEPEEDSDYSLDTKVKIRSNWGGLVTFDPGENRTNAFGRLFVDTRRLKLASGTTVVTGPATSTGEGAITYVKGTGTGAFSTDRGYLLVDGGELYSPKMTGDRYVDVSSNGWVVVTNGGKVAMAEGVQWINGLNGPGKLTVANGGSLSVNQLRVSQSGASQSEVHLDEGGLIAVYQLRMDNASTGLFAFNGGCLQATKASSTFYAGAAASWENVAFIVGEKGAGFDLSNGVNLWWGKPLVSGAAADGGLFKRGAGILVLTSANAYNGPTVIESGRVQARVDHAIPDGTTLRLGGEGARFTASTYESENPRRDTVHTVARVEGSGELDNMVASSVTGAVAPSEDGILTFMTTCSLSGDYEVTVGENGCSCLKVAAGQDISGLKVKVMNASALDKDADRNAYKILDAAAGYEGRFDVSELPGEWGVRYASDGAYIRYNKGLSVILR